MLIFKNQLFGMYFVESFRLEHKMVDIRPQPNGNWILPLYYFGIYVWCFYPYMAYHRFKL